MRFLVVVLFASACATARPAPPAPPATFASLPSKEAPRADRIAAYERMRPLGAHETQHIVPYVIPAGSVTYYGTRSYTTLDHLQLADGTQVVDPRALLPAVDAEGKAARDIAAWDATAQRAFDAYGEAVAVAWGVGLGGGAIGAALCVGGLGLALSEGGGVGANTILPLGISGAGMGLAIGAPVVAVFLPNLLAGEASADAERQRAGIYAGFDLALRERLGLIDDEPATTTTPSDQLTLAR